MTLLTRRGWRLVGGSLLLLLFASLILAWPAVEAARQQVRPGLNGILAHSGQADAPAIQFWKSWPRPAPPSTIGHRPIPTMPEGTPNATTVTPDPPVPAPAPATPPPDTPDPPAAAPTGGGRLAVAPPTADHQVMAPPSVGAALIDEVLARWNSPASGQGALFYDLGVQYGIDPAYALAFYIHESGCGTKGVARFTMSIGNIRATPGYRDYEGYRAYDSWEASIADWYKLIKELYVDAWGLRTVAQIIPTYAPAADHNDPAAYINSVIGLVDSWQR
jgi:hypothetical protein